MTKIKQEEPQIDYEGFYKLHGHELTGRLSRDSTRDIEQKLMELYEEIEDYRKSKQELID